jgi:prepilin-type N-terminal cleavage/methylation domain-containing protein
VLKRRIGQGCETIQSPLLSQELADIHTEICVKMCQTAKKLGVEVVNGFTGSSIWHLLYSFPPASPDMIKAGYDDFAKRFTPILDAFKKEGIKFGLEVHPTEIAFDIASAQRAIDAVKGHECFGFNYDPSHLGYQGVDYVKFIRTVKHRLFHTHSTDVWWGHGDATAGAFGAHSHFGDPRRYWDFRSIGHGDINFEEIIVAFNSRAFTLIEFLVVIAIFAILMAIPMPALQRAR